MVRKNGPNLKASEPDAESGIRTVLKLPNYQVTFTRATTRDLVDYLRSTAFLDRPVVDQTAITAAHTFDLTYTPGNRLGGGPQDMLAAQIPIFLALRDQLGLDLVPKIAPCEFLVIDHLDKPSAN
jgi:uncharacterized protein (TIGR03435 family)